ncbi:mitochondrial import inner membrane translocase subunit tim23 [Cordyceps fumosorosea ARSEF 2679]|uniref:Mitochondrial import inner membrane translocase subunit tim23 n=1 Tax=Cordyceps fumosorosea (strain ARSEF 2679) TaxID=1081104 RepID=A0A167RN14_CORFA|nr:mitochondrial import inner membrane translocase subunit tim23 [Cordyceps fumosorosea ARSEF 2679]OAA58756.1 mitochondrial import inner membrane translocase subunit tim23 [Cordyceps fumosorosea ARSEF 2679]
MSSLWNAFSGGNKPQQKQQQHQEPTTTFGAPAPSSLSYDPTEGQGVESFLQSTAFADPSQLHPLAGLNRDTLEYLSLEDSALSDLPGGQSVIPSRGFTDDLCYGTGTTYVSGLAVGGAWGLQEGLRKSAGQPPKLRLNATLNAITRRGPFLGNSAGVVAIVYNMFNSLIGYARGKHDAANSVVSGVLSGMLFKSTRGLRPMLISGGIVGSVAAAWTIARRSLFSVPEPVPSASTELETL